MLSSTFYKRRERFEEASLKKLKAKQKAKVEELKKKTSYYTTRNLIERFDESRRDAKTTGASPRNKGELRLRNGQPLTHRPSASTPNARIAPSTRPVPVQTPSGHFRPPPPEAKPYERHWYDRLVDVIVGENEASPNSKYALICEKCSNHNGLALPSEIDEIQYTCPRCGFFNKSRRDKRRSLGSGDSPQHSPELDSPTPSPRPQSMYVSSSPGFSSSGDARRGRSVSPTRNPLPSPLRYEAGGGHDSSDSASYPLDSVQAHRDAKRREALEKLGEGVGEMDEGNIAEDEAGMIPDGGKGREGGGHDAIDSGDNERAAEKKTRRKKMMLPSAPAIPEDPSLEVPDRTTSPRSMGGEDADVEDGGEWEKMDTDE